MNTTKRLLNLIVRILTVPAIVTGITIFLLYRPAEAFSLRECLYSLLFLTVFPLLAYPLSELGSKKKSRREKQRSMAFIFSLVGYTMGSIWAFTMHTAEMTRILFSSYLLSAAILIILNKLRFHASGHACSSTAPAFFLIWNYGWPALIPCLLLIIIIYSSSISLKRHTFWQLITGSAISVLCCLASILAIV